MFLPFVLTCLLNAFLARQSHDTVTVAMTGDIMMGTTYPSVQLPSGDGRQLFVDVASVTASVDVAAGNLEGTLNEADSCTKHMTAASYAFRTPTVFAPRLKEAGFDFLSMANNHAFDFGMSGVRSTMASLDAQGIRYAGLKCQPSSVVLEKNGVRYGFCAFGHNSYTHRHQDEEGARRIIAALADRCDIVVVSFHGGAEGVAHRHLPWGKETFYDEDRGSLREFARLCVDAGADIVYGHGPHVIRALELYKDRIIAYSLGNFCTPYGVNISGISGYAPVLEVKVNGDGRFVSGKIHSFLQVRGMGPRADAPARAAREIKQLTESDVPDTPLHIDDAGNISRK